MICLTNRMNLIVSTVPTDVHTTMPQLNNFRKKKTSLTDFVEIERHQTLCAVNQLRSLFYLCGERIKMREKNVSHKVSHVIGDTCLAFCVSIRINIAESHRCDHTMIHLLPHKINKQQTISTTATQRFKHTHFTYA